MLTEKKDAEKKERINLLCPVSSQTVADDIFIFPFFFSSHFVCVCFFSVSRAFWYRSIGHRAHGDRIFQNDKRQ